MKKMILLFIVTAMVLLNASGMIRITLHNGETLFDDDGPIFANFQHKDVKVVAPDYVRVRKSVVSGVRFNSNGVIWDGERDGIQLMNLTSVTEVTEEFTVIAVDGDVAFVKITLYNALGEVVN